MLEIFGAVGTAVTLGPIVIKLAQELRNAYKSVKYARRELEELTNEMDIFTDLYSEFLKACSTRKKYRKRVSSAKTKLVSWTRRAIMDFEKLLRKVDALARDPIYQHNVMETALAHCKWYFSKNYLGYLRASVSVARQSMVSFTNIYNTELLDEQLIHLNSIMTAQQRRDIEQEYGMTPEQLREEVQGMRDTYEVRLNGLPLLLQEAQEKVFAYQKRSKDDGIAEQTRQIRRFSESVDRYVHSVLPADHAGNRPPRPSRRSSHGSRRHRPNSSLTSQSTATTSTQSSKPSHHRIPAPESPLTSLEPSIAKLDIDLQPKEEEDTISILNLCKKCSGTCTNAEAHNSSIQDSAPDPVSHTIWYVPTTAPGPFSMQANDTTKPGASIRPHVSPVPPKQPSSPDGIPVANLRPNSRQRYPPEPSVEPADESSETPQISTTTQERDEDDFQDGTSEEEISVQEQSGGSRTSIWKATGGFEGDMPKGLRIRRQRSRSPQDFW